MAQMNISVPDGLKQWADDRVAEGNYASTSDYVRDLMRRDRDRTEKIARLRAALEAGRDSGVGARTLQQIYDDNRKRRDAA